MTRTTPPGIGRLLGLVGLIGLLGAACAGSDGRGDANGVEAAGSDPSVSTSMPDALTSSSATSTSSTASPTSTTIAPEEPEVVDDPAGACRQFEELTAGLDLLEDRQLAELGFMEVSVGPSGFSVFGMPAATISGDPRGFGVDTEGVSGPGNSPDDEASRGQMEPTFVWGTGTVGYAQVADVGYQCVPLEPRPETTTTIDDRPLQEILDAYDFTYTTEVCASLGVAEVSLSGWDRLEVGAPAGSLLVAGSDRAVRGDLTGDGVDEVVTIETCGPVESDAQEPIGAGPAWQPWGPTGGVATASVVGVGADDETQTLWTVGPTEAPAAGARLAPAWVYRGHLVTIWVVDWERWIEVDYRLDGSTFVPVRSIEDGHVRELE